MKVIGFRINKEKEKELEVLIKELNERKLLQVRNKSEVIRLLVNDWIVHQKEKLEALDKLIEEGISKDEEV